MERSIPARRPEQEVKNLSFSGFCCSSIPLKENEKIDKYLDLTKELKKLWNMKVMVIPVLGGALGTVPKGLEKKLGKWKSEE